MDIPAIVNQLPIDERLEVKKVLRVLSSCGIFESILSQAEGETLQAAMVLAHNRNYEEIERASIRLVGMIQLFDGLIASSKEV